MLIEFIVNGFKPFSNKVCLDMTSNNKIKNNSEYILEKNDKTLLKSAVIYGSNNTGKSSLLLSFEMLKNIILNGSVNGMNTSESSIIMPFDYNLFNKEKKISYEISFIYGETCYRYELAIKFDKSSKDNFKNGKYNSIENEKLYINDILFLDRNDSKSNPNISEFIEMLKSYSDKLLITNLPNEYKKYTDDIIQFFNSIYFIIRKRNFQTVFDNLSTLDKKQFEKFKKIIINADINLEDVYIEEKNRFEDAPIFNLISKYKFNNKVIEIPSVISDSDGTKVFMDYIINCIKIMKNGGILVVDELDKSLHTFLTKAIVSLFNNEDNNNSQLIFTTHDLMLLETKYLFRKDQIWFTDKEKDKIELYSMGEFKANKDSGARNIALRSYLQGLFGALPYPDIEDVFYEK